MKSNLYILLPLLFLVSIISFSCKDEEKFVKEQELKIAQHNDSVYDYLTKNWNLRVPAASAELGVILKDWKPWQEFVQEVSLKPVSTIGAFQKRANRLSELLQSLTYQQYPKELDLPDIKSRMALLQTSLNNLNMFLEVTPISIEKLDQNLKHTNTALRLLLAQMDENIVKAKLPQEEGEAEMLEAINEERRANPTPENE
ncbi:hypothetical protein QK342_05775 [Myroides odoratimimus]|uniref:hypothetical protein n=1 Tax=Myroides odoratimimus TaxID=76832 RepID=UPI00103D7DCA|nr:hypothetical protein [Myroides odoratimimus]MDM1396772.1 hypothetical protein [Myroides odoratimimus]MDM1495656.1 hypothetical protein [Myroides odoratimimus]MDM1527872.1 hypothetical protein [Myroides odoratimimus]QBK75869.1 hypothetical protein E0Z07_05770 [Myroides odoratimimus]WHT74581.1 hypothetical protein QK342_05775 [Myroides odoratimimus]